LTNPVSVEVGLDAVSNDLAEPVDLASRTGIGSRWVVVFDLLAVVGGLLVLHSAISGSIPSGGDGGNWLALAREWLGEEVMAAEVVYEPVFIGLLGSLLRALDPIPALVTSSFVAEAVLICAVYFMTRGAGRAPAIVSSALVGVAGYRLEAYAWGAYPQMLALGFGLVTVWAMTRFVSSGRWGFFGLGLVGIFVVLSTHKLVGALVLMAIPAAALHSVWLGRLRRDFWRWAGIAALSASALGAFFVSSWLSGSVQGVEPTLNPLGLGRWEQLVFVVEEAVVPWMAVMLVTVIALGLRSWNRHTAPLISASFGWIVASAVAFAATGEPRILIQAQVAALPVAVVATWRWLQEQRLTPDLPQGVSVALVLITVGLLGSIGLTGLHRYEVSADWYRVVGDRELRTLDDLAKASEPGDVAVASRGPNGNPIGWWVQGYAGVPTLTSIDPAFLAFPDERAQAAIADHLFTSSAQEAGDLLREIEARFVIVDRRGPDVAWAAQGSASEMEVVRDGTLLVLITPHGP
jgi:hypothetical protein